MQETELIERKPYKPRRTIKPVTTQLAILAKRTGGASIRKIAKDLGVSPNTVTSNLALNNFDAMVGALRLDLLKLGPEAVKVLELALANKDRTIALKLLEGLGALSKDAKSNGSNMSGDTHLTLAIQNLIQPAKAEEKKANE